MQRRFVGLIAALSLLRISCGIDPLVRAASPSSPALQSLMVRRSDLAPGYRTRSAFPTLGYGVVDEEVGGSRSNFNEKLLISHGFQVAYDESFDNSGTGRSVDNFLASFRDSAGAHWAFSQIAAYSANSSAPHPQVIQRVGDEDVGIRAVAPSGIDYIALFHTGNYVVEIQVIGPGASVSSLEALSRVVDNRIRYGVRPFPPSPPSGNPYVFAQLSVIASRHMVIFKGADYSQCFARHTTPDSCSAKFIKVSNSAWKSVSDGFNGILYGWRVLGSVDGGGAAVLFFDNARYVGASDVLPNLNAYRPVGPGTFSIDYREYKGGDAQCCPTGAWTTAVYQWTGSKIKRLPPE